jgi:hypothetical protein
MLLYDTVIQYVLVSSTLVGLATRYYFLSECYCLKLAKVKVTLRLTRGIPSPCQPVPSIRGYNNPIKVTTMKPNIRPNHASSNPMPSNRYHRSGARQAITSCSRSVQLTFLWFYHILQTFQSKTLRKLGKAPWYISNVTLRMPYVTELIRTYAKNHKNLTAQNNNQLIRDLFNQPKIGLHKTTSN